MKYWVERWEDYGWGIAHRKNVYVMYLRGIMHLPL